MNGRMYYVYIYLVSICSNTHYMYINVSIYNQSLYTFKSSTTTYSLLFPKHDIQGTQKSNTYNIIHPYKNTLENLFEGCTIHFRLQLEIIYIQENKHKHSRLLIWSTSKD